MPGDTPGGERPAHVKRRRRAVPLAAGVLVVVGLAVAGVVTLTGGDEPSAEEADDEDEARPVPTDPAALFAFAADRLDEEGSFTFEGTTRFEGTMSDGPGVLRVQEGMSSGQAELPGRYTEATHQADGTAFEVVVDRGVMWWRQSAFGDRLAQRPWVRVQGSSPLFVRPVLRELPGWLDRATSQRDGGEDENGRTVVVGDLPTGLLNDLFDATGTSRFIQAELTVTVDGTGLPVRVELEAATSDAVAEMSYRLHDFGAAVEVTRPRGDQIDTTPFLREEDIAEYEGPAAYSLAQVPADWILLAAYVAPDPDPECSGIALDYGNPFDVERGFLHLQFVGPECLPFPEGVGEFTAGDYTGVAAVSSPGVNVGAITIGDTIVAFQSDLSVADLSVVLASLGPLDLDAQPAGIEGLPSTPA